MCSQERTECVADLAAFRILAVMHTSRWYLVLSMDDGLLEVDGTWWMVMSVGEIVQRRPAACFYPELASGDDEGVVQA